MGFEYLSDFPLRMEGMKECFWRREERKTLVSGG